MENSNITKMHDEYLEKLWKMKEDKEESNDILKDYIGKSYDDEIINDLLTSEFINYEKDNNTISLTEKGEKHSRNIIRAHRIAEKLVFDVLGGEFESSACEMEHIVNSNLVDSICILLGHPKVCPHGLPIPEGECCRKAVTTAETTVIPLTQLSVGKTARVVYVNYDNDRRFHKIYNLQIRPGTVIKLLQKTPAFVISCEGSDIAIDDEVASNIYLWKELENYKLNKIIGSKKINRPKKRGRFGFLRRKNKISTS